MKQTRIYFTVLLLCAFALVAAPMLLLPGCGTTAAQRSYHVANTTEFTVSAAMTAWGNYVAQFHPPAKEELRVKNAYDQYHAAMLVVADAGKAFAEGTGSQGNLDLAISTAAASLTDLVNLIQTFGVQIQPTPNSNPQTPN